MPARSANTSPRPVVKSSKTNFPDAVPGFPSDVASDPAPAAVKTSKTNFQAIAASSQNDFFDALVAILNQLKADLKAFFYENKNRAFVEKLILFEEKTGAKREHLAYCVLAVLALYLIVGHSAELLSNIIGFVYPAYASFKTLRSEANKEDEQQWYTYWALFGCFMLLDMFSEDIWHAFPIYYLVKTTALLYLALPQTRGATLVYKRFVEPVSSKMQ